MTRIMKSPRYQEVADEYGYDADAFIAYCYNLSIKPEYCEAAIDDFEKSYIDYFHETRWFVRTVMEERGYWVLLPDYIRDSIDWEQVFSKEFGHDFWKQDNYYFKNI